MHLFISDLHLLAERPATTALFLDFLSTTARRAEALYILGDLFEYWAGDDDLADPFNSQICAALRQLADSGVNTFFICGNRDFLIGEEFARAAAVTLLEEPVVANIAGYSTLLLHGDALCTDDIAYQRFRAQVRDPQWQRQFLALPLAVRKQKIAEVRQFSEAQKQVKAADIMDVNAEAVVEAFRRHGYARMIHGHTHRPAAHLHRVDGRDCERRVLVDWYEGGGYIACDADGCRAVHLP